MIDIPSVAACGSALVLLALPAPAAELNLDPAAIERFGLEFARPQPATGSSGRRLPAVITVPPEAVAVVSSAVPGLIVRKRRAVGETVERGEPLATLKSAALVEMQSEYLREHADLALARSELDRDRALAAAGAIPARRLDATRTAHTQAQLHVAEMRSRLLASGMSETALAALTTSGRLVDEIEMTAPLSGVVLEARGDAGARIAAMSPLYRLAATDRLWVESRAPQEIAAGIAPGQDLWVGEHEARAVIIAVSSAVDTDSSTVLVRAELPPGTELRPGQFVMAEWGGAGATAWLLPAAAVVRRDGDDYVFVRTPGGVAARAVTVSGRDAGGVRLSTGLTAADVVVVAGTAQLKSLWLGGGE